MPFLPLNQQCQSTNTLRYNKTTKRVIYTLHTHARTHTRSHARTHAHTQPFNGPLSRTIQVGQKKHSPTRAYPGHQTSFINFLHLLRSEASSLKVLFHNLCPGPLWSTSWSATLYFILHTLPGHYLLYLNVPYQNIKYERVKYSHNSCRFAAIVPVNIGSFIAALIRLMLMPFK